MKRRPLVEYAGENLQEQALRRVAAVEGGYVAESRSEANTLGNLYKRGWLARERIDGRWAYRLREEPLFTDEMELLV